MSKPAIPGYRQLSDDEIAAISSFKMVEEHVLGMLDELADCDIEIDPRWYAIGRTKLEESFMAINRSIARPERMVLPEPEEAGA